jgi:transcriptional regulator of aromatic amino acid metabolism
MIRLDVRIIAATNTDFILWEKKPFRSDLLHRLNVLSLTMPPLRECLENVSNTL